MPFQLIRRRLLCIRNSISPVISTEPACPRLLHNSKMSFRPEGEIPCSTRAPKLYMGFLLLSVIEMTITNVPYPKYPPLPYQRSLPTEAVAQLQNVSFRPKGEIPCSTRVTKLYMGFLLR